MPPDLILAAAFRITPREGWDIRIIPAAGFLKRDVMRRARSMKDAILIIADHTGSDCRITRKIFPHRQN
jgi:hypothetical protein